MTARKPQTPGQTARILAVVFFTFIGFLCVGLPLAVLPGFVLNDLGYGSVMAGLVISLQYLVTLISRPVTGMLIDRIGPKRAVVYGLGGTLGSGVLTLAATSLHEASGAIGLGLLLAGRVALGISQALIGTGSITWGIGRVGAENTARVISWNGIASYGAIAIGAPLGVLMASTMGLWSIGAAITLLSLGALWVARDKPAIPVIQGKRLPFHNVFLAIAPNGLALALGSIGFGTLATFVTLYYASLGWEHAAYCLTAFGLAFIAARLLFAGAIERRGGYRVATICLAIETLGLLLLWISPIPALALCGAALTGFGLSLVYPALGVEAIGNIPAASRSSALGAYALFFDLALGVAGPLMGLIATAYDYGAVFLASGLLSLLGLGLSLLLLRRAERPKAVQP
ncbi:MFS transporter [Pseudomonas sp. sia0905]|uniref:MFS transporter n=1 Tax=Pseudomonas sp. sia0905 TaxID=2854783 RepID=UPI001C45A740|nr:MFS transporter [Pseudomonas sp. sia0905]MBV7565208.1 MFS transporter [Pseudomonas sp. sia0905]